MQTKLFRTSGFQIALLYLGLLSVTLLALVAFIYWSTANLIDRQMRDTIGAEIRGLAEQYRQEGLPRLVELINARSGPTGDPQNVYLLVNPMFAPLVGNLTSWPEDPPGADGWLEVRLVRGGSDSGRRHLVRGRVFDLTRGYHLFVGRDTVAQSDFQTIMVNAVAWALVPTLVLGLLGGLLIGRYSLRRIDAVSATGEDIVNGDLSRRVPLTGSGDEFDRLAQTINKMLDQIDMLMTGMRTVTDSLAHDLRSPLTRAKSGIELALRKDTDVHTYTQVLEQTNAEIDTILRTFEALISITHAEVGMNRLAFGPLDVAALVSDLVEVYQPMAEGAGITMTSERPMEMMINGHRQLLAQATANLMENAIKFTPAGGRIEVSLKHDGGAPVLAVCDSGPGIPPDDRERVLQRFVRLDDSRGAPGSGLGLSLVAAVARLHGGRLMLADNKPGLSVTLTFPEC